MATTLADIAKAAKVSIATASRVLSNSDHPISSETRRRVLELAEAMDYRPNWLARGMRTERTQTIGIIADDLLSPFTPPIIRGIQDFLKTIDYLGLIINSDWDPALEQEAIKTLLGRSVDAFIFVESGHLAPTEELEQAQKPYMFVHRLFGATIPNSVVPDDFAGTMLAMRHLFSLGHHRIAHITGPLGWHSARRRLDGYRASLEEQGIEADEELIVEGDWKFEGGVAATQQLLQVTPRPTAIFVANDHMAWGAIDALREAGLRAPDDVAIVSYDNRPFSRVLRPKLTTVSLPAYEMGQRGAALLWEKLQSDAPMEDFEEEKICGTLYIRESCGADPSLRTVEGPDVGTTVRHRLIGRQPTPEEG